MSSVNICALIGDNLWEQVKVLDYQKPLVLIETIGSSDIDVTAQSQGSDVETGKKYDFTPEEIQRLKDVFASGPLRYKPSVDNRLLKLSVIRYGKGGKHVEPVEGSWSDTYLDSGLLSSAEGPKKQTTQESLSLSAGPSGFVNIKCETPDELDLVAEALDEHFETYVADEDPLLLKVRVYRTPNAEDQITAILKTAGLAGDIEDETPVMESRTREELDAGLRKWVEDYIEARHAGNVELAKSIKANIDRAVDEKGLDAHEVYLALGDPDKPESSALHFEDHPADYLDVEIQVRNPDGSVDSESQYGDFLRNNDDEEDGIPEELAYMEPGEARNIGGGAAPEMLLVMKDKSGVWESVDRKEAESRPRFPDAEISLLADQIVHHMQEPTREDLMKMSESGNTVADLVEKRLGRRSYDNEEGGTRRGACHRRSSAGKDRKLQKKLHTLLDQDDIDEVESKKA
jgi:hypothetical protein